MHADDQLVVVTPWYPTPEHPYGGIFVQRWIASLGHDPDRVTVIHLISSPGPSDAPTPTFSHTSDPVGSVIRVTYDVPPRTSRADTADLARAALSKLDPTVLGEADVIHAHVGLPTGAAVLPFVPAGIPFVTIEHASYLKTLLDEPRSRAHYAAMLARSTHHLMVGELEARRLRLALPQFADKITAIGNPVDGDLFPLREQRVGRLDRWLYVGNLLTSKGVGDAIAAYAEWRNRHRDRDSSFRIIGQGLHREKFEALARNLGVADHVAFDDAVQPDQLAEVFAEADLLIHLSHGETFGMTMVEAAIGGLPVIASRTGGAEETLRYATAVGMAGFVDVRAGAGTVAKAVDALEAGLRGARREESRAHLLHRYGTHDFGHRLMSVSRRKPRHASDGVKYRATVISSGPTGAREAMHICQTLVRAGAKVTYVTADPVDAQATDRRIKVVSLWPRLKWSPLRLLERAIYGLPRFVIRSVQFVFRKTTAIGGRIGRLSSSAYWRMARYRRRWDVLTARVHERLFDRLIYQATSGGALARYAMRVSPDMASDRTGIVIYCDPKSTYLAWLLARELPRTAVMARPREDVLDRVAHSPAT